jgi:hypothetical protein
MPLDARQEEAFETVATKQAHSADKQHFVDYLDNLQLV